MQDFFKEGSLLAVSVGTAMGGILTTLIIAALHKLFKRDCDHCVNIIRIEQQIVELKKIIVKMAIELKIPMHEFEDLIK